MQATNRQKEIGTVAVIKSNPDQSKHLETATVKVIVPNPPLKGAWFEHGMYPKPLAPFLLLPCHFCRYYAYQKGPAHTGVLYLFLRLRDLSCQVVCAAGGGGWE